MRGRRVRNAPPCCAPACCLTILNELRDILRKWPSRRLEVSFRQLSKLFIVEIIDVASSLPSGIRFAAPELDAALDGFDE